MATGAFAYASAYEYYILEHYMLYIHTFLACTSTYGYYMIYESLMNCCAGFLHIKKAYKRATLCT